MRSAARAISGCSALREVTERECAQKQSSSDERRHRRPRCRRPAQQFEPVNQGNAGAAAEQKAGQVEARRGGGAIIADERQCIPDADQAERQIEEEDTTGAPVA